MVMNQKRVSSIRLTRGALSLVSTCRKAVGRYEEEEEGGVNQVSATSTTPKWSIKAQLALDCGIIIYFVRWIRDICVCLGSRRSRAWCRKLIFFFASFKQY